MIEFSPSGDWALVLLVLGAVFLVRFALMVRRLRRAAEPGTGVPRSKGIRSVATAGAFGREFEPERRQAVRLLVAGSVLSVVGLALALWLQISALAAPFAGWDGVVWA